MNLNIVTRFITYKYEQSINILWMIVLQKSTKKQID